MSDKILDGKADALCQIANFARLFLEEIWPTWPEQTSREFDAPIPQLVSERTCGRSSTFSAKMLNEYKFDARVEHGWFCGINQIKIVWTSQSMPG
jgi:hypothetical protein